MSKRSKTTNNDRYFSHDPFGRDPDGISLSGKNGHETDGSRKARSSNRAACWDDSREYSPFTWSTF